MTRIAISCVALAILGLVAVHAAPQEDFLAQLPTCEPFDVKAYSGYLNVTETKQLHYMFVESQDVPSTDPVVIWFNGGPGCSSLLGYFMENGPFVMDDGQSVLHKNPDSWNRRANTLYIESPAGVGFSIAGTV